MDYTEQFKEAIQAELVKQGYNTSGENGANKVVVNVFIDFLAKQDAHYKEEHAKVIARLEALEPKK